MVIQLALEGALDDHFRQFPEQAALTGELQPAGPGSFGKLTQQLLSSRRQLRARLALVVRHVSHWCLLRLGSYTVEITVPTTTRTAACLAAGTVKGRVAEGVLVTGGRVKAGLDGPPVQVIEAVADVGADEFEEQAQVAGPAPVAGQELIVAGRHAWPRQQNPASRRDIAR